MLRVGLTGGLGAGKSTLARLLSARGAVVRDADAIVEELYRPGGAAVGPVVAAFGEGVRGSEGGVDRGKLAAIVAADPRALATLSSIVHPLVRAEVENWLARLEQQPNPPDVAIVEAALLVETGSFRNYHRLIVVTAPMDVRWQRAMAFGFSPERARRLLSAQAGDEERIRVAHYVVANGGSLAELAAKAERLWWHLRQDAQRLAQGISLEAGEPVIL